MTNFKNVELVIQYKLYLPTLGLCSEVVKNLTSLGVGVVSQPEKKNLAGVELYPLWIT